MNGEPIDALEVYGKQVLAALERASKRGDGFKTADEALKDMEEYFSIAEVATGVSTAKVMLCLEGEI